MKPLNNENNVDTFCAWSSTRKFAPLILFLKTACTFGWKCLQGPRYLSHNALMR